MLRSSSWVRVELLAAYESPNDERGHGAVATVVRDPGAARQPGEVEGGHGVEVLVEDRGTVGRDRAPVGGEADAAAGRVVDPLAGQVGDGRSIEVIEGGDGHVPEGRAEVGVAVHDVGGGEQRRDLVGRRRRRGRVAVLGAARAGRRRPVGGREVGDRAADADDAQHDEADDPPARVSRCRSRRQPVRPGRWGCRCWSSWAQQDDPEGDETRRPTMNTWLAVAMPECCQMAPQATAAIRWAMRDGRAEHGQAGGAQVP